MTNINPNQLDLPLALLAQNQSSLGIQVGGGHYKKLRIQPAEYNHANDIPFLEGNVIKYTTRWRDKGGIVDLEKAIHTLQLLIDLEKAKNDRT